MILETNNTIILDAIYCHIIEKNKNQEILRRDILYLIKGIIRLPKSFDDVLLKELESRGYIKKKNHQGYYICRGTEVCEQARKKVKKHKPAFPW